MAVSNALILWSEKMCHWLEAQVAHCRRELETCRFITMREAYEADMKNYAAMARHGRLALAAAKKESS